MDANRNLTQNISVGANFNNTHVIQRSAICCNNNNNIENNNNNSLSTSLHAALELK